MNVDKTLKTKMSLIMCALEWELTSKYFCQSQINMLVVRKTTTEMFGILVEWFIIPFHLFGANYVNKVHSMGVKIKIKTVYKKHFQALCVFTE